MGDSWEVGEDAGVWGEGGEAYLFYKRLDAQPQLVVPAIIPVDGRERLVYPLARGPPHVRDEVREVVWGLQLDLALACGRIHSLPSVGCGFFLCAGCSSGNSCVQVRRLDGNVAVIVCTSNSGRGGGGKFVALASLILSARGPAWSATKRRHRPGPSTARTSHRSVPTRGNGLLYMPRMWKLNGPGLVVAFRQVLSDSPQPGLSRSSRPHRRTRGYLYILCPERPKMPNYPSFSRVMAVWDSFNISATCR